MSSSAAAPFSSLPLPREEAKRQSRANYTPSGLVSDEALLASVARNDRDALACLFQRYSRLVHGIGRRILRDNTEAEDLVQEVFLHIARKCYLYDGSKSSARSWIVQMTYFQALNRKGYLTKHHYYSAVELQKSGAELLATPIVAEYDHSAEAVFGRKRWQKVREILTEDQWETIRLHFFEGCTFAEISQDRNQPVGNVRNHFYRGLARLRKCIFRNEPRNR